MHMVGLTNKGKQRTSNQDDFYLDPKAKWCMVADGMGGHQGGETASRMAVEAISHVLDHSSDPAEERLRQAIAHANRSIYQASLASPSLLGMGTTVVVLLLDGDDVVIGHVGDSRAYLLRGNKYKQITTDHSIVQQLVESGSITPEEAKDHPQKNYITRAVGTDRTVQPDILRVACQPGDVVALCTDGLTAYVDGNTLCHVVSSGIEDAPARLVQLANEGGGQDNITVVLAQLKRGMKE